MELVSLTSCTAPNTIPGLLTVQYAPIHWTVPISWRPVVSAGNNWQYALEFVEGRSWLSAYALPRPNWTEGGSKSPHGKSFSTSLTLVTPKLRPSATGILAAMLEPRWILLLTDRAKQPWLVGSYDMPAEFSYKAQAGGGGRVGGYELTWTVETDTPTAGYVPVL